MSSNPMAKVAYLTAKSIRKNKAVIQYCHESIDHMAGVVSTVVFERDIYLKDIEKVSDWLVTSGSYQSGDLRASVPILCLSNTRDALSSDPATSGDGISVTLSEIRPWRESTGGMVCGIDKIKWNGDVYVIIRIEPSVFWYGTPAIYRIGLRRNDAEQSVS
jgi:hypothetical protein